MKLFENEFVKISLDEKVPCIEWYGKQYMPSDAFRLSEEKSLEFYLKYKNQFPHLQWFVDARNVGAIQPADTDWVAEKILPQFAMAGLKKEAFVVPSNAIGKLVIQDYRSKTGQKIQINLFDSEQSAKNWLRGAG